jgi:tRNA A-37 threonylcarbamoyl transferase component Bud32
VSETRVGQTADGRAAVMKEATGPAADRLRREADVLRLAAHSGVVELVESLDLPQGGARLSTAYVGGRTLADARPPTPAAFAATLAATLAELHDRGIVHGRLRPEHVLVGPDGAPVVCGWGAGLAARRPRGAGAVR